MLLKHTFKFKLTTHFTRRKFFLYFYFPAYNTTHQPLTLNFIFTTHFFISVVNPCRRILPTSIDEANQSSQSC